MANKISKSLEILNSPEVQEEIAEEIAKEIKLKLEKEKEKLDNFYKNNFQETYNCIINEEEISFEQNLLFCDCVETILLGNEKDLVSVVNVDNETLYYFYKKVKIISIYGCSPRVVVNEIGELQKSEVIFDNDKFQIKKLTFILNGNKTEKEFLFSEEDYVFDIFSEYLFENQLLSKAVK